LWAYEQEPAMASPAVYTPPIGVSMPDDLNNRCAFCGKFFEEFTCEFEAEGSSRKRETYQACENCTRVVLKLAFVFRRSLAYEERRRA